MRKILLYMFLWVVFGFGCETIVEIDIPVEAPSLVINSTLSDKEYFKANISESKHILDGSDVYKKVQGATVEIYEDGNLLTLLADSLEGNYISNSYKPVRGKMYEIVVSKNGFETASANVLMPLDTAIILGVKIDTVVESEFGYTSYYLRFSVEIKDNPEQENFYDISIYQKSHSVRYDYTVDPPEIIDTVYYYNKLYIQSRDPGLEEFQSFGQNIIFNDELFNGSTYRMNVLSSIRIDPSNPNENELSYFVELANTSESYYRYELSSQLQYWTEDNPFAQPVTVYNNIENGFGIFGAYNTAMYKVKK